VIATFRRERLEPPPGGSVVSLGMFDGVHLGHQAILEANAARARELGARSTVVTFRRHPKKLLLGNAPRTLTTLEHRLELFSRAGIEHAAVLNFDSSLRALTAAEFTEEIAVRRLGVRRFVLGFDSKFDATAAARRSSCARAGSRSTSRPRSSSPGGRFRPPRSARPSSSATSPPPRRCWAGP
jgi:riboflavin kinase/FMN adenylyltransferase